MYILSKSEPTLKWTSKVFENLLFPCDSTMWPLFWTLHLSFSPIKTYLYYALLFNSNTMKNHFPAKSRLSSILCALFTTVHLTLESECPMSTWMSVNHPSPSPSPSCPFFRAMYLGVSSSIHTLIWERLSHNAVGSLRICFLYKTVSSLGEYDGPVLENSTTQHCISEYMVCQWESNQSSYPSEAINFSQLTKVPQHTFWEQFPNRLPTLHALTLDKEAWFPKCLMSPKL